MGKQTQTVNQVRIIGGVHRGRKLSFPDQPGLRPTGDRIRETLFNWLQQRLPGAICLDLFAGSGALGLEAASRGAKKVVMLDRAGSVVTQLRENCALLGLDQVQVVQGDAMAWLEGPPEQFDIVFLDPPFMSGLLQQAVCRIDEGDWLRSDARVYIETDLASGLPELPSSWRLLKEKKAGQVAYYLVGAG